ncbi:MAG: hypothetical protein WA140_06090 [Geobacteraceae bacterium]
MPKLVPQAELDAVLQAVGRYSEGNIARYRLRPSEYRIWRETWR